MRFSDLKIDMPNTQYSDKEEEPKFKIKEVSAIKKSSFKKYKKIEFPGFKK